MMTKEQKKDYNRNYRIKNRERLLAAEAQYREDNAELISERRRGYRDNHKENIKNYRDAHLTEAKTYRELHKDENKEYKKKYYLENREAILLKNKANALKNKERYNKRKSEYQKNRRKEDIVYKLRTNLSTMIGVALRAKASSKQGNSILKYLPYTFQDLKKHLESQFEPWMTWDNWGKVNIDKWNDNDSTTWTWNIDHIIPKSFLPYTSMEDENFKKCWALENLRPLSAKRNCTERDRK